MQPLTTTEAPPAQKPASPPSRGRAWAIVTMLFAMMVINFADKAVIGLAAGPIMRDLGLDAAQFGLLSSGFFLFFVVSAVAIGFVGNRVPTRWLLLIMVLLWSVTQAPMIGTVGFAVLLVARSLLGFAEGPAVPIAQHAAHKWFDNRERNLVTGIIQSGATIGVIVASPVLTWIIVNHGWHAAFAALFVVGLAWAVIWLFVGREGPSDARTLAQDDTSASIELLEGTEVPYRKILTSGTWMACLLGSFALFWALGVMTTWLPSYLGHLGYTPMQAGLLNTLPWVVMGVLFIVQALVSRSLAARGVSSRIHRGLVTAAILTIAGISMIAFPVIEGRFAQLVLITVAFSFCEIMAVVGPAAIAEVTSTSRRAGALGVYIGVSSIGAVLSPTVTGELVDAAATPLAGFHTAFVITAALTLASALVAALYIRPERDARRLVQA